MKHWPLWTPLAAVALALSWLLPNASPPWIAFHKDAWHACIMLIVSGVVLWRYRNNGSSSIDPIGLILLLMVLMTFWQWYEGIIYFHGHAAMGVAYFGAAALATVVGRTWGRANLREAGDFLFGALLLAAIATIFLIWTQWLELEFVGIWIQEVPARAAPFGNLNQPNNAATLLLLGGIASMWFWATGRISLGPLTLVLSTLLFSLALTGSRIGYLNVVIIFSAVLIYALKTKAKIINFLPLLLGAILFGVGLWIANGGLAPPPSEFMHQIGANVAAFDRDLTSTRWGVWRAYWAALQESPWWGFGYEQGLITQAVAGQLGYRLDGLFTWSHNAWIDVATWFGLPIALALAFIAIWASKSYLESRPNKERWIIAAACVPLVSHGLVELPLAFAYFLIPLCLFVGALSAGFSWPKWRIPFLVGAGWHLSLGLLLAAIVFDYLRIESTFYTWRFEQSNIGKNHPQGVPSTVVLNQFEALLTGLRGSAESLSDSQIEEFEKAVMHDPSLAAIQHLAEIRIRRNDIAGAQRAMDLGMLTAKAAMRKKLVQRWEYLAKTDPRFARVELNP